jgi:hypothetical protein
MTPEQQFYLPAIAEPDTMTFLKIVYEIHHRNN